MLVWVERERGPCDPHEKKKTFHFVCASILIMKNQRLQFAKYIFYSARKKLLFCSKTEQHFFFFVVMVLVDEEEFGRKCRSNFVKEEIDIKMESERGGESQVILICLFALKNIQ